MNWLPDDVKEASGGDAIDNVARDSIRLAHAVLDRFPDLVRRHKVIAGGAAISSSLVIVAGVAIARRIRKGQTAAEAVADVTEQEIDRPERISRPRPSSHLDAIAANGNAPAEEIPPVRAD
ncbi:MAG: hypothetical protein HOH95_13695 [Dehalococcoidia bacterium]|jgi:hypothetical protein|nr:hypothetical protein [Dehalococcoidia bacterium]